ncbi:MAG: Hpt domain-containing protein, partial [Bacteroidales bacterium]|nr:Hpt domain-containing protein [Bacteroidales bacterium]
MAINQDDLLKELLEDFRIEAEEHLSSIDEGLIELEKSGEDPDQTVLERVYRETHSLKGAARAVNLPDTEKLCMLMENIMSVLKNGEGILFDSLFDVMHKSVDSLRLMLSNLKDSGKEKKLPNLTLLLKNLDFIHKEVLAKGKTGQETIKNNILSTEKLDVIEDEKNSSEEVPKLNEVPKRNDAENETIRISSVKLNKILAQSEDFIAIKTTLAFYKSELAEIKSKNKDERLEYLYGDLTRFIHVANRMIDDIIIDVKSTLLLPFSTILNIVPRIVRDLARDNGKEIEVEIKGDFYEIDKRILEDLKDPLIHLIRNCADHGIESVNERLAAGKKSTGKICITISKDADAKLSVLINDDGGGIKIEKVVKS